MRFFIETLGCKVNQYESRAIAAILTERGHTEARRGESCDAVVVNTCAVTGDAERRSRQAARRLRRLFPDAVLAICGCAGELEPEALRELGAILVSGSGARREFALALESLVLNRQTDDLQEDFSSRPQARINPARQVGRGPLPPCDSTFNPKFELLPVGEQHRARAALKIQDGCDNFCAYCVIPFARGRSRSIPIPEAVDRARELERRGFREIIITGIEICSYGQDLGGGETLGGLLRAVSDAAPGARVRLGSLEPSRVTEDFVRDIAALPRLCDHFHMSLQSGSAATLRRMRRAYTPEEFYDAASRLRERFPNAGVTADVIAGFPGETEAEFLETAAFLEKCAFSALHVFPYSARPGTLAAGMDGQIPRGEKKARAAALREIGEKTRDRFLERQLGRTLDVLFERESDGFSVGHTGNYIEVREKVTNARGEILPVFITAEKIRR
ncbi:MAG: tRNA (N(6)-L-threonylcarbamoyladenosine(37)-C(2))-methylthiotransferase MtaB [Oscillospiraceae bacterium]|jgi:threonylcarbamoyladenosine tRNA methylthiotransferase MtaB|nr:tRNA (N(6)-L-threonylcarbamoyladenosine(37)-C(2))-methylthiotransferase MtaB [Oscillospiraceae bacterium]